MRATTRSAVAASGCEGGNLSNLSNVRCHNGCLYISRGSVSMAERKSAGTDQSAAGGTTSDVVEQKVVELAEQLGWFLGTVRAKADGWLDRENLRKELGRIRDGAAELLDHVNRASESARKAAAKPAAAPKAQREPGTGGCAGQESSKAAATGGDQQADGRAGGEADGAEEFQGRQEPRARVITGATATPDHRPTTWPFGPTRLQAPASRAKWPGRSPRRSARLACSPPDSLRPR